MSSGSASAKLLVWTGAAYAVTGSAFTLYDPRNLAPAASSGWQGYAIKFSDRNVYELVGGDDRKKLGKTDAAHNKNANGTVSIWSGTPGSETDTTINVTAYNAFGNVLSGKFVWLEHNGDGWYLTAAAC